MTEGFNIQNKALCVQYDPEDRFYTTQWNLRDEVKAQLNLPEKVFIRDTTLREGEETPGVVYTLEQKLKIARMLDEIGIHEIDCGFASLSPQHLEFLKAVKAAGLHMKTMAITRVDVPNPQSGIDLVVDAGADVINTIIYGTPIPGFSSEEDYVNLVEKSARYVKKRGAFCSFLAPVTRWEYNFAEKVYSAALRGGADRVEIGGAGILGPAAFKFMVRWLKGMAGDRQVGLHIHDSFGTSTACVLAGVEEGAEVADTSVNGLGDGAGIAALEEVVVALSNIYRLDLGIKIEKLTELSKLVQEISGVKIWPYKPIIGDNIFAEGPDTHLERLLKGAGKWSDTFFINPAAVGQKTRLLFGPSSLAGRGVRAKAEKMGISLSEGQLQKVIGIMDESFKKGIKSGFTEEEIESLINET